MKYELPYTENNFNAFVSFYMKPDKEMKTGYSYEFEYEYEYKILISYSNHNKVTSHSVNPQNAANGSYSLNGDLIVFSSLAHLKSSLKMGCRDWMTKKFRKFLISKLDKLLTFNNFK